MAQTETEQIIVKGPITPEFIANLLSGFQSKTDVGAHDIFLGQVRADIINGREVVAIEYSAYEAMANKEFQAIREEALSKYELSSMHIYHSMGIVRTGEICLLVLASSARRKVVFQALQTVVEEIKKRVPVFGKEIFEDDSYQWKVNT